MLYMYLRFGSQSEVIPPVKIMLWASLMVQCQVVEHLSWLSFLFFYYYIYIKKKGFSDRSRGAKNGIMTLATQCLAISLWFYVIRTVLDFLSSPIFRMSFWYFLPLFPLYTFTCLPSLVSIELDVVILSLLTWYQVTNHLHLDSFYFIISLNHVCVCLSLRK